MTYQLYYKDAKPEQNMTISQGHPNAKALIVRWIFNEGAGALVRDVSGRGNDLSLTNVVSADWTFDKHGRALRFVAANSANGSSAREATYEHDLFTLSAWIRMDSLPTTNNLMAIMDSLQFGGPYEFHLGVQNSVVTGNVPAFVFDCPIHADGTIHARAVTPQIYVDRLYHVVAVRSYDETKIYLNGVLQDTDSYSAYTGDSDLATWVGRRYTPIVPWYLDGVISDLGINDYPFDDQDVLQLYEEPYGIFVKNPMIAVP